MSSETGPGTFTGQRFSRKPRRSVLLADKLAERMITISGIGGIFAVSLVGLFLVWVVLPLLAPSSIGKDHERPPVAVTGGGSVRIIAGGMDGYGTMAWSLDADGAVTVRELEGGAVLQRVAVRDSFPPTAWAIGAADQRGVLGYADGSIQVLNLEFLAEYYADDEIDAALRGLAVGERAPWRDGLVERTPAGQLRHQTLVVEADEPVTLGESPIALIDVSSTGTGLVVAALDDAGVVHHRVLTRKRNLLTGKTRISATGSDLDLAAAGVSHHGAFAALKMNDTGTLLLLLQEDGETLRIDARDGEFAVGPTQDLAPAEGATVTAAAFLTGKVSLAVGDSHGGLTVWFSVTGEGGRPDRMVPAHPLSAGGAAVTSLGASARSRMIAAGRADGSLQVFHVTTERLLGASDSDLGPVRQAIIAPREDRLLAVGDAGAGIWAIDAPHAEVSPGTLLRPVWYEGYPEPAYVWQSSAGTDSFEPKLSLVPLIFGTLKATFYSLLFGLPLAVLAAIFTSEFVPRTTRARVKPVIEIMASLPSVVLGFLAALVMAPIVERVAVEFLSVLLLGPFVLLLGAHLWQLLPRDVATRALPWRPAAIFVVLLAGALLAWRLGPALEALLFAGDFKGWLEGRVGSGVAGWLVLLLVPSALAVAWLNARYGDDFLRSRPAGWTHLQLALADLARFLVAAALTVALALALGWLLNSSGWDPRGSVFGTYVQRNALVVGVAMGFAVIPIIYTISEDALVSVPDHLRAASLGAGATPWQTAVRVVIPPAMSGLFSAAMIGLGRAVGETMIVLMAAGNTPIMEWNIFNGFRTLSANLAVELPEAVQNSTHYRTLFLAALTLFVMTFILNTVAEAVRLHFRRKTRML